MGPKLDGLTCQQLRELQEKLIRSETTDEETPLEYQIRVQNMARKILVSQR